MQNFLLIALLLIMGAHSLPATDFAKEDWPQEVILIQDQNVDLTKNGQPMGKMLLKKGATVKLIEVKGDTLLVDSGISPATVPTTATNFTELATDHQNKRLEQEAQIKREAEQAAIRAEEEKKLAEQKKQEAATTAPSQYQQAVELLHAPILKKETLTQLKAILDETSQSEHPPSLYHLARFHYDARFYGPMGIPRDPHKARQLVARAAELGWPPAKWALAPTVATIGQWLALQKEAATKGFMPAAADLSSYYSQTRIPSLATSPIFATIANSEEAYNLHMGKAQDAEQAFLWAELANYLGKTDRQFQDRFFAMRSQLTPESLRKVQLDLSKIIKDNRLARGKNHQWDHERDSFLLLGTDYK